MVGPGSDPANYLRELVDRVSERLVLSTLRDVASNVCTVIVETQLAASLSISKAAAGLLAGSSSGDAPIAIDPEIAARNPRSLS